MADGHAVLTQVKDFAIGRSQRDRNYAIPPSVLFKLCMEVRLESNREAINQMLGGRYVIKAQSMEYHKSIPHGNDSLNVRISQGIGQVGEHSFEYMYSIYQLRGDVQELLATVCVVCVAVKAPGEKLPLPPDFKALAAAAQRADLREARRTSSHDVLTQGLRGLQLSAMPEEVASRPDASATLNQALIRADDAEYFGMPVLLRPSDEDWNHHINNTSYIRFFESSTLRIRLFLTAKKQPSCDPNLAFAGCSGDCP
eukprot:TRINITY_DN9762_c0_g2_i1.p1 TRINITY_DN9762_c0_g2~~TRINITY_DN9762_c0_g2_i1.p1  ORF type:complete len:255 (+),score=55.95 TRINITY_DN9762_c0_g2_i1:339-1103(+)